MAYLRRFRGRVRRAALCALTATAVAVFLLLALPGVAGATHGTRSDDDHGGPAVYTLTNDPSHNQVLVFSRRADGSLVQTQAVDTGGKGGLLPEHGCMLPPSGTCPFVDAQNEVILGDENRLLFAVNPGSNTISSFRVGPHGLELVDQVPSGGTFPTSLTVHDDVLYALDAVSLNIAGFRVSHDGTLTPIPGSQQPLSAGAVSSDVPAKEIQFDRTGRVLAVSLLAVPVIDTFKVDKDGVAGAAHPNATANPLPFAFSVTPKNQLVVAEIVDADSGAPASRISTYQLDADSATLSHIATAADNGYAACWTASAHAGRYIYAVNTGGGVPTGATVSVMKVERDGSISLVQVTPPGAPGPIPIGPAGEELARTDDVVSGDNQYLYVLAPGVFEPSRIDIFKIGPDGLLTQTGSTPTDLPPGISGLAAS